VKARGVVFEDDDLAAGLGWVTTVTTGSLVVVEVGVEMGVELDGGLVPLVVAGAV